MGVKVDIADIKFFEFNEYKKLNNKKSLEWFAPKPFINGDSCPRKNLIPAKRAIDVMQSQRDNFDKLVNPYPKGVQSLLNQHKKLGFNYQDAFSKISDFDKNNTINSAMDQFKNLGLSSKVSLIDKPFHDLTKNSLAQFKASQIDMTHLDRLGYKRELINNHFGGFEAFKSAAANSFTNNGLNDSFAKINNLDQLKIRDISGLSTNRTIDSISKLNKTFGLEVGLGETFKIETLFKNISGTKDLLLSRSNALKSVVNDLQNYKSIRNSFVHSGVIPSLAEDKRIKKLFLIENEVLPLLKKDLLIPPRVHDKNKKELKDLEERIIELNEEVKSLQNNDEYPIVSTLAETCISVNPGLKRPSKFSPTDTIKADTVYYAVECTHHFESVNGCLPTAKELWTFIKSSVRSSEINILGLETSIDGDKNTIKVEGKGWDEEACRKFHSKYFCLLYTSPSPRDRG